MDELDRKILRLLEEDGRMTVKNIAQRVALTSPAVSERIRRMEAGGVIAGYTVVLGEQPDKNAIDALISISVSPADRDRFLNMAEMQDGVQQCFHVTGGYSFIVKVHCSGIAALEHLINRFQKLGQTSSQIILSTPVDKRVHV